MNRALRIAREFLFGPERLSTDRADDDSVHIAPVVTTGQAGVAPPISKEEGSAARPEPLDDKYQYLGRPFAASRRSLWFMPESQFQAVRYLEKTGREAYRLSYSIADNREVTHYHFPDGFQTTSEDAAVDHLHEMMDAFERARREEPA